MKLARAVISMVALWATLFAIVSVAQADTIVFDSFVSGNQYDTNSLEGNPFDGSLIGGGYKQIAFSFLPTGTISLTSIDLALAVTNAATGTPTANVTLYADNNDSPGAVIETYLVGNIPGGAGAIEEVTSTSHPVLVAGERYWVSPGPGADDTDGTWCNSTIKDIDGDFLLGTAYVRFSPSDSYSNGGTARYPALRVSGSVVVPEASTWLLLASALPMCFLIRVRRN